MPAETQGYCDPRSRLAREKYFCLRPRPLERWLWSKRIPASAERVFWLHWQEGMQRGDWCSEIPLSRVARECDLDVSTVTRAYQVLTRLDCVRRTDQGRDPANPFQQATALTEVRVPRELLAELNRHPNRRANSNLSHQAGEGRVAGGRVISTRSRDLDGWNRDSTDRGCATAGVSARAERQLGADDSANAALHLEQGARTGADRHCGERHAAEPGSPRGAKSVSTEIRVDPMPFVRDGDLAGADRTASVSGPTVASATRLTGNAASESAGETAMPAQRLVPEKGEGDVPDSSAVTAAEGRQAEQLADPFPGLTGRERVRAIAELVGSLSDAERCAYQEALRMHQPDMVFDAHSKVPASAQRVIRRMLGAMSGSSSKDQGCAGSRGALPGPAKSLGARKLTGFELGRLSREIQAAASVAAVPELMRQVVWSIEAGALKRFDLRHAVHIALKKIREGQWTRPHRMPPNWVRALSNPPVLGTCGGA